MDADLPSVFEEKFRIARKEHKCCECHKPIRVGEKYHFAKGCWEGRWDKFKTCLKCNDLRFELKDGECLPPFESLGEWASEAGMDIFNR